MVAMLSMGVSSCSKDDPEPSNPEVNSGQDSGQKSDYYSIPINILRLSNGIAFNWENGSETKYFYWEFFSQEEYDKLSKSEVVSKVVTGNPKDRITPKKDDFACIYNCLPNTTYIIATVSFSKEDKQGELSVTYVKTKSSNNQPLAPIDGVTYAYDSQGNYYYQWNITKNTYCSRYYTYAAASPDYFLTFHYAFNGLTPMVAWLIKNEIDKNIGDHSTNINVSNDFGWDFDNGRDKLYTGQIESGIKNDFRAFVFTDNYFLVLTWGVGVDGELSGVISAGGADFTTSYANGIPSLESYMVQNMVNESPKKFNGNTTDIELTRIK